MWTTVGVKAYSWTETDRALARARSHGARACKKGPTEMKNKSDHKRELVVDQSQYVLERSHLTAGFVARTRHAVAPRSLR